MELTIPNDPNAQNAPNAQSTDREAQLAAAAPEPGAPERGTTHEGTGAEPQGNLIATYVGYLAVGAACWLVGLLIASDCASAHVRPGDRNLESQVAILGMFLLLPYTGCIGLAASGIAAHTHDRHKVVTVAVFLVVAVAVNVAAGLKVGGVW